MLPIVAALAPMISSAIASLSTILPTIGKQVMAFIAKIPGPVLEKALQGVMQLVGNIVQELFQCKVPCEEIGYKARIAPQKSEDFKTSEEYVNYLNKNVEFDKEKYDKMSPLEQTECKLAGMQVYRNSIDEKMGIPISPLFFALNALLKIDATRVLRTVEEIKKAGVSTDDFVAYFKGTCDPEKVKQVGEIAKKVFNTEDKPNEVLEMMSKTRDLGI